MWIHIHVSHEKSFLLTLEMIHVFLFAYVFLYLLPLLHSATYDNMSTPICPKSFSCPAFGPFSYPFYDDTNEGCGLIAVNCTLNHEKVQFGGQSYEIAVKLDAGPSVLIRNRTFEELGLSKSCETLMDNFTSPSPDLFTISIQPLVTIFKCMNDPDYAEEIKSIHIHSIKTITISKV
ncbi:hypothetical protein HanRHA438_Chr15g0701591 [Helianthus annuus]|uniref:Uncharacterized protein n=1 Tax=Helianthus annuus TaxID=4232 RepID=A0A251S862_HELAN|nr:hypothetical protein HanXRQr2_Chr15g0689181 [Helianthus annuus]KAF5764198.1 hypothetical protein HanXRQr2_Chr15g0689211 [Helianthus annuus]KAJ0450904.1 putative LEAF RUST 10 DISEASE-RESISTANCE LOCUS RECEPTOR-LIKE PROTEIN KINASE-like 1.1/1.2/1.3/1.4 [Helianthus annuus]KAJ0455243.1 hypothetical protein HanIR_Chr15g0748971 [Helianthus annuus]KAJ0455245.1 hypothetical protein HanIR_Chr15g0748991 [Helianthus annuus]